MLLCFFQCRTFWYCQPDARQLTLGILMPETSWLQGNDDTWDILTSKALNFWAQLFSFFFSFFLFSAMLFFSKRLMFYNQCFPLIANSIGICVLQEQLKSELYFRENCLDKIKSQVRKFVKMQAINFKSCPNVAIESSICFVNIKRSHIYFIKNNLYG